jgi:hypothetical protein
MAGGAAPIFMGGGTGAVQGAGAGAQVGGPWGAAIGGTLGLGAGAASGYFQGKALGRQEDAEEEAQRKYREALDAYSKGTEANDIHQLEGIGANLGAQQKMGLERFTTGPTGQDYAASLQSAAGKAGADAKSRVGPAQTFGGDSAYTRAAAPEQASRYAAALAPAQHEMAIGQVKQIAAQTAQKYGLESGELNAQLAHIANTHGVEKAQLAARFAMATGQYPLDMQNAKRAGEGDAMIAGYINMGMNAGSKGADMYGGMQEQKAKKAKDQATLDEIRGMRAENEMRGVNFDSGYGIND